MGTSWTQGRLLSKLTQSIPKRVYILLTRQDRPQDKHRLEGKTLEVQILFGEEGRRYRDLPSC